VNNKLVETACLQFLNPNDLFEINSIGTGLINHTYIISDLTNYKKIILQAINTKIFTRPEDIISNYEIIYQYLKSGGNAGNIPAPIPTREGCLLFIDTENNYWRANSYMENSYSPMNAATEESAYTVARSFASFTNSLAGLDIHKLKQIIPDFHNLSIRYDQFEKAIQLAPVRVLLKSTHILAQLRQRKGLVSFYDSISKNNVNYPERVMHHDCKINNILFDSVTNEVICPVDLDTTMPGKFFSDIGDMIRTMACTVDENSREWEEIKIRPLFYEAILKGYLEGAGDIFTEFELKNIHYAGLILIYMQSLRFITDYLNGDIYYKKTYPDQNLNRALNQLILLEKLEEFLKIKFLFDPSFPPIGS
jgi:thiamine kinase-like enzyme